MLVPVAIPLSGEISQGREVNWGEGCRSIVELSSYGRGLKKYGQTSLADDMSGVVGGRGGC